MTGSCGFAHGEELAILSERRYQYMIETIIPAERRADVYDFWRTDRVLLERCKFVAGIYQKYLDEPTAENYFVSLLADYMLEGLYFYNGSD